MNDLEREKKKGLSFWYLKDVPLKRAAAGPGTRTPGFGLAGQLFATLCRTVLEKLGPEEGEALIREAVQSFGRERGKRIAQRVKSLGKPLSFKNWLIYGDIAGSNFSMRPVMENGDLLARVGACSFLSSAEAWQLGDYAKYYCRYADYAILEGYNPEVKLELKTRHETGEDHCLFRYIMKEENK